MPARKHTCRRKARGAIEGDADEQSGDFFLTLPGVADGSQSYRWTDRQVETQIKRQSALFYWLLCPRFYLISAVMLAVHRCLM